MNENLLAAYSNSVEERDADGARDARKWTDDNMVEHLNKAAERNDHRITIWSGNLTRSSRSHCCLNWNKMKWGIDTAVSGACSLLSLWQMP